MTRQNTVRALRLPGALLSLSLVAAASPALAGVDTPAAAADAAPVASAAASKLSVTSVRRNVIAGQRVVVRGTLRPAGLGRSVALQVLNGRSRWTTVDRDRTDRLGRYKLTFRAGRPGTRQLRVAFRGHGTLRASHRLAGRASIFRRAFASWYGPGLYGNHLACGGTLTAGTLGVAHKTLPCGTKVTLRFKGRSVRVPVVDRGPYVGGRDFDLTAATKQRLGFGSTGVVLSTR